MHLFSHCQIHMPKCIISASINLTKPTLPAVKFTFKGVLAMQAILYNNKNMQAQQGLRFAQEIKYIFAALLQIEIRTPEHSSPQVY